MSSLSQVLLIDDDDTNREALTMMIGKAGFQVATAASGEEALEILAETPYAVIITDLFLPGVSGIEILKTVKTDYPYSNVILITGHASAETAVEAMKEGAFDYITKPVAFDKLQILIRKALEKSNLVAENLYLRQQLRGRFSFDNIVGHSPAMQQVFAKLDKIVHTDSTILILGESGTGKELVARAIHFNGARRDKPFVAINCGAIPADLLESELFGHVRGAFTGAVSDKPGKFEQADGGTVFLDEIGTMPQHLQMKLLRVLQEQEVERVGGSRRTKLNVRVISATNAELEKEIKNGRFREDLYYRLNVIPIHLPPVRRRREDIPLLVRHFLQQTCREMSRPLMSVSPEAMRALQEYDWPGNVREMQNIIERTIALSDADRIEIGDLPQDIGGQAGDADAAVSASLTLTEKGLDMPATISSIEAKLIADALQLTDGVKARAAGLLGINRTTLVEKIKRLGLESHRE